MHYLCGQVAVQTSQYQGVAQEMVWAICPVHWLEKPDGSNTFSYIQLALPFQSLVLDTNNILPNTPCHATTSLAVSVFSEHNTELKKLMEV